MKSGVIITSGWPDTGIYQDEQRILERYHVCLPKDPSAVFSGVADRHEAMHRIYFPIVKPRKFPCLGSDKVRVAVTDPGEKNAILNLLRNTRPHFVFLTDHDVVAVIAPKFDVRPLVAYLILMNDQEMSLSVLGEHGAVKTKYTDIGRDKSC